MRALSFWQPWAWLVVNGRKTIENRPWNSSYRGELFVHAGKKFSKEQYEEVGLWCISNGFQEEADALPPPEEFESQLGGIVGVVTIVDVLRPGVVDHDAVSAKYPYVDVGWHMTDRFGFVLHNGFPTRSLIPCPGRQRWWDLDEEMRQRVSSTLTPRR